MTKRTLSREAKRLEPFLNLPRKATTGAGSGGTGTVHVLAGGLHTGELDNSQAPQFLLLDGSRALTGNLSVSAGVTIDGVDLSVHAADPNAHHDAVTVAGGLILSGQQLTVDAGAGLRISGTTLYVADGDGISIAGDLVSVEASDLADGAYGIEVVLNDFRLKIATNSGLTLSSGALTLGTPSGVSVSSANGVTTTTHTHAVTSSSNPGAAASLLATDSAGTLALDTDTLYIHAGFDNVWINSGTPDGSAALKVTSANSADISLHVQQVSGQTARILRIDDTSGQELIVLDSVGNLQSGNPGFVSGLTGWQITPIGNAEFNNGVFRGELHASIFVVDEFHASGGTLVVAPGGKLENDFTVNYTTGSTAVIDLRTTSGSGSGSQLGIRSTGSGSGTQLTTRTIANHIDITDPESGHAQLFGMGDTLRIKAIGSLSPGIDIWDVWMKVSRVEDLTDYWRYHVEIVSGGAHGVVIPAGTAAISYGVAGDGRILLTADQSYAPYQDIFTIGAEPWNGDITPHIRLGRLDGVGLPGVSGIEQYGLVAGEDLSNADSAYLILSNLQQAMYRIQSTWHDAANPTVSISPDGRVKIGLDVGNTATTAFDFNPVNGTLTIGNASYPAAVTLYGNMTITAGTGYGNLVDIPTSLSDINGSEGTKLTGIEAGATVGAVWGINVGSQPTTLAGINAGEGSKLSGIEAGATVGANWSSNVSNRPIDSVGKLVAAPAPAGAGLYLGSTHMGYYSGSAWTMYMDNTGKQGWGGESGARLAWDGTDLYGTNGTTVQWYARASTGKIYAGAGAVWLDSAGINLTSAQDSVSDALTIKWLNGADRRFSIYAIDGAAGTSTTTAILLAENDAVGSLMYLIAKSPNTSNGASVIIQATQGASSSQWSFIRTVGGTVWAEFPGDLTVYGDIDGDNIINIRSTA